MKIKVQTNLLKQADTLNHQIEDRDMSSEREDRTRYNYTNPLTNKRNQEDQIHQAPDPVKPHPKKEPLSKKDQKWMGEMGVGIASSLLKSSELHATMTEPECKPPRDKKLKTDEKPDDEGLSDLTPQERLSKTTKTRMAAIKTAIPFNSTFDIFDQHMIVNIPKVAKRLDLTPQKINQMENQISKALNVRAKYSHITVTPAFEGVSLEFLLV